MGTTSSWMIPKHSQASRDFSHKCVLGMRQRLLPVEHVHHTSGGIFANFKHYVDL